MTEFQNFINNEFKPLMDRIAILERENKELREKVSKLEQNPVTSSKFTYSNMLQQNIKTTINDNEQENVLKCKITKEIKLQETKENNIIISGVPKPTLDLDGKIVAAADDSLIKDIFNHIGVNITSIKHSQRIKTKAEKLTEDINPILIKFKDLKCKIEALKNAKKLKTFLNHKLFFNHDLTESERQVEKVLRDERKRLIGTLSEEDDIGK